MSAEGERIEESARDILRRWPCCPYCGASERDGSMCKNCLAFAGGQPLLVAAGEVHAPSTKEKQWTMCGIYSAPSPDHPIYKQQLFATKVALVTCPFCIERIEVYQETGIPPRLRPL